MTGVALLAVIAVERRFQKSTGTCRYTGYTRSCTDDLARRFVSEHDGVPDNDVADGAFSVVVKVRSTDADVVHSHLNFTGTWRDNFSFKDAKASGFVKFGNEHVTIF